MSQYDEIARVTHLIDRQTSILAEIRDELRRQTDELGEGFGHLGRALEWVEQEIRLLKNATLSIEKAKAEAIIDTKREQMESAVRIWSRAKERFASQYRKVIADYVKGLEDNVHRFTRLVSDELSPMFKINEGASDFQQIIEEMRPKAIDNLRTETAVNMSGMKGSELMDRYKSARESLTRFYNERKALVDRIEAAKSVIEFDLNQQIAPGETVLFRIPFYAVTFEDANGNLVRELIGPSNAVSTEDGDNELIPKLLEPLAPSLKEMVAESPAFDIDRMIGSIRPTGGIPESAQSAVSNVARYLTYAGMSKDLAEEIQQFYGPDCRDWQPEAEHTQGDDEV